MSKMDRTLSRTPSDVERKYGLGQTQSAPDSSSKLELQIQQMQSALETYTTNITNLIEALNTEIETLSTEIEALKSDKETYLVTFYDADKVVIVSYAVKQGDSVNSPLPDVKWVDSEGTEVTFPYTPTLDTDLYVYQESTL